MDILSIRRPFQMNLRQLCADEGKKMSARKQPEDYRELAESRGIKWLGPVVSNTQMKTGWECGGGHRWQARYGHIQQGRGCINIG